MVNMTMINNTNEITLIVGDLHLHPDFLERISNVAHAVNASKIVFLGDYQDYWNAPTAMHVGMIERMIDFHDTMKTNMVYLLGNHDVFYYIDRNTMYFNHVKYRSPGHDEIAYIDVHDRMRAINDLFKISVVIHNPVNNADYLCSHAGVTNWWINKHCKQLKNDDIDSMTMFTAHDYMKTLNNMLIHEEWFDLFTQGKARYGHDGAPSPLWADKVELDYDYVKGLNQIVGHTPMRTVTMQSTCNQQLIYCDTMSYMDNGTPIGDGSLLVIGDNTVINDNIHANNADGIYTVTELSAGINVIIADW